MRLHSNSDIAPGHVAVLQKGDEVLFCRIGDLLYEPGDDAETIMIVNPADLEVARATWFEPKGIVQ